MQKKVCVITGGGSGMGLAAAKEIGKRYSIIIAGRTLSKLENAVTELKELGVEVEPCVCDVSDRASTNKLARFATVIGEVGVVINAAGLSPNMGDAITIMSVNAMGVINMHNSFIPHMKFKSCYIDISSMSAYLTPGFIMPKKSYNLAETDSDMFLKKMMRRVNLFPKKLRSSVAYGISKDFVIQHVKNDALRFGKNDSRILSVSPGNFDTPMGDIEKENALEYIKYCAIKRLGHVDEIAVLLSNLADEKIGYLTGVDILCDGGCVASGVKPSRRKSV